MTQNVINVENFTDQGPADIIVDLPYLPRVEDALVAMGVRLEEGARKTDPTIDLGLIRVKDVKESAETIARDKDDTVPDRFPPRDPPRTNLDMILIALRQYFQNDAKGWSPEIGKNRTMNGVHGAPHIGGSGYPAAADAPVLAKGSGDKVRVGLIDTKLYPSEQGGFNRSSQHRCLGLIVGDR
ncbi:MAG TPA: hypothetical protein VGP26_02635 [Actinophytocola sp.]|jgi:hypothetical protein|nr:hypothetical protein [Actinophytocola sp.]